MPLQAALLERGVGARVAAVTREVRDEGFETSVKMRGLEVKLA